MFHQIGGVSQLVKGKTVALKLNLTGKPTRFPVDPALPYRNNPDTVLATAHLLARAGAKRIRIIETFFPPAAGDGALGEVQGSTSRLSITLVARWNGRTRKTSD